MKTKSLLATVVLIGTALAQEDTALGEQSRLLPDEILELDVNDDGAIDVEEHQAIRDYRQQLDREQRNSNDLDDDGETTDEEIEAAREAVRKIIVKRRKKRFNEVAGDDGLLSIDEFAQLMNSLEFPKSPASLTISSKVSFIA